MEVPCEMREYTRLLEHDPASVLPEPQKTLHIIKGGSADAGCVSALSNRRLFRSHTEESSSANKYPLRRRKFWLRSRIIFPSPSPERENLESE
jgi:hypothetical protein